MTKTIRWSAILCAALAVLCAAPAIAAQDATPPPGAGTPAAMPTVIPIPPEAQAGPNFNSDAATEAYLRLIPPAATARSDAYFEGGYWLILWDFLYGAVVCLLLLNLGWSGKMRDVAEKVIRFKPLQTWLYWTQYIVVATILSFPLSWYEGYFREHQYGMATQTFGPWIWDETKGLMLGIVLGGIVVMALFGVVRRLERTWWIWGAVVTYVFTIIGVLIAPVYLVPIFNTPKLLKDPAVTAPILRLARANDIPTKDVYEIDASKQTTRMSANVSGFGSTMRITLNDNLLRRASPEEIQSVMGHEMGHYVLNHVYKFLIFYFIVIVGVFAFLRWAAEWTLARWGERWQIRGVGDTAVVPLALLLISTIFFFLTPILNTYTRTEEHEADMYGLNAARQPDGFAQAAIHLGEYRKMSPGRVEEWIFYDHPSGRNRIHDAMRWKAENLQLFERPAAQ